LNTTTAFYFVTEFSDIAVFVRLRVCMSQFQGRTQGGLGLKPPLELDFLQKLDYLRKGD